MLRIVLTLLFCLPLITGTLHAEFILDDFNDSAQVVSPEMEGDRVTTSSVGFLKTRRQIVIDGQQADPIASLDSNVSFESHLTAKMVDLNPAFENGLPRAGLSVSYDEFKQDFTEDDTNNAIFFDFATIVGPTPPSFLVVFVRDATNTGALWLSTISPVPAFDTPQSLAIPFSTFTDRIGRPGADFKAINNLSVEFLANGFFGEPEELGWSFQLDRIRVGRIPEPTSLTLVVGFSLVFGCRRLRR